MTIRETLVYKEIEHIPGGIQAVIHFENGYGASVIKHPRSYGGPDGLFEIAVLKDGQLCYDTPITDDVIGWCDDNKVEEVLNSIKNLGD